MGSGRRQIWELSVLGDDMPDVLGAPVCLCDGALWPEPGDQAAQGEARQAAGAARPCMPSLNCVVDVLGELIQLIMYFTPGEDWRSAPEHGFSSAVING